jgi:hypothetical protein
MNSINILIKATQEVRNELAQYSPGGRAWGDCYIRLCTLESLLLKELLSQLKKAA